MGDAQATLLPPARGSFTPATPSGLTPNTRSEAEAALTHNSMAQTDSAAPTTPLRTLHENMYSGMRPSGGRAHVDDVDDGTTEAQKAYRRPAGPIRTSSTNYETALRESHRQASVASDLSADTMAPVDYTDKAKVESPVSTTLPFPPPGQGVVPLHPGVGSGQAEVVKRARPTGLSLGDLSRKQSWSQQDMRHMLQGQLMSPIKGDAGYDSGTEGRAVGPS